MNCIRMMNMKIYDIYGTEQSCGPHHKNGQSPSPAMWPEGKFTECLYWANWAWSNIQQNRTHHGLECTLLAQTGVLIVTLCYYISVAQQVLLTASACSGIDKFHKFKHFSSVFIMYRISNVKVQITGSSTFSGFITLLNTWKHRKSKDQPSLIQKWNV